MKHTPEKAQEIGKIIAGLVGREITYSPEKSSVDKSPHPSRTFKVVSLERFFYSLKEKAYSFTAKVVDLDDSDAIKFRTFNFNKVS